MSGTPPHTALRSSCCLVALAAALFVTDVSAEPSKSYLKCQQRLDGYAAKYRDDAGDELRKHDRKLDDLVESFLARWSSDEIPVEEMRQSLQAEIDRYPLAPITARLVDEPIEELTAIDGDESDKIRCADRRELLWDYRDYLRELQSELERIRDAVAMRIEIEDLDADEGLMVVAFYGSGQLGEVLINRRGAVMGSVSFTPDNSGEYFRLVKVKAGDFFWHKVTYENWMFRYWYDYSDRGYDFTVEPGKINYAGVFVYEASWNGARGAVHDRPAIVLTVLEQRYPELVARYDVVNGLVPDDHFIDFYVAEKRQAEAQSGAE